MLRKRNPGDPLRIGAGEWNAIADVINPAVGAGAQQSDGLSTFRPLWAWVYNGDAVARIRGDVLAYTAWTPEAGVDAPVGDDRDLRLSLVSGSGYADREPAVLLENIGPERWGRACISGPCYAKMTWTAANRASNLWYAAPNYSSRVISPAPNGNIRLLAQLSGPSGSGGTSLWPVFLANRSPGRIVHFRAPAGGIAAFNAATGQLGSAVCNLHVSNASGLLTDSGATATIYNSGVAFPASSYGAAAFNDEGLLVVVSNVTGLRLSGELLQYTVDGSVWVTWHTGTTC
jgi:hypothetical protein